jgi:ATP-dependent helicase/nuclease subunit A
VRPDPRSALSLLWPVLGQEFLPAAAVVDPQGTPAGAGVPLLRLKDSWQPAALPAAVPVALLPAAHLQLEPPEFSWVGETQRHIGTVVHGWLAQLATAPLPPGTLAAQRPLIRAQLARLGVAPAEQARALELIVTAMSQTLADPRGRWILDPAHREAAAELPLTGVSDGRLRSIVVDRSFVDAEGTRWLIDYKTSRHEGGGLEEFLAEELERYRPQLQTYAGLAAALGPQPVRAALYFPLLQAWREL